MKTELDFLLNIDKSFVEAASLMDLEDLPEDIDDEEYDTITEGRHHCGTCQVRTIMEIVWPSVQEYIDWLKGGEGKNE